MPISLAGGCRQTRRILRLGVNAWLGTYNLYDKRPIPVGKASLHHWIFLNFEEMKFFSSGCIAKRISDRRQLLHITGSIKTF